MAVYPFVTLDVFTDQRFGGNPLAVFPDAAGLDASTMQALAREFNLSETAFVQPPDDPASTARVRIFTPQAEVPFAGHPNVGTVWVLAGLGRDRDGVLRFEEEAGSVEVAVERRDGQVAGCRVSAPRRTPQRSAPRPRAGRATLGISCCLSTPATPTSCAPGPARRSMGSTRTRRPAAPARSGTPMAAYAPGWAAVACPCCVATPRFRA